jgi:hypothetical protein
MSIKDNKISSLINKLDMLQKQKDDFEYAMKTQRLSQFSQQEHLITKNVSLKNQA